MSRKRIKLNEEGFKEWMETPETKRLLQYFEEQEHFHRMCVATGEAKRPTLAECGAEYLGRLAAAEMFARLSDLEFDDLSIEEEEDDVNKRERPKAAY